MYADLTEHPFAIFMAGESYESPSEKAWLAWAAEVEEIVGHDLDGDEDTDGYSIDGAYAAWEAGDCSPAEYAAEIAGGRTNG